VGLSGGSSSDTLDPHLGLTEWTIRLRPGVTFHSGRDLTSADVVYTIHRIVSKGYSGSLFFGAVGLKGVKAVDWPALCRHPDDHRLQ
jgi:peptide/nickel transport system substrate-binding protein